MLKFSNLAIRRGARQLFSNANFTIHQGNKVGITGANGCGKSSLFALLLNELHSDEGEISFPPKISIAHVAQETPAVNKSALDYVLDGDAELRNIQQQLEVAEQADDGEMLAELHHQLEVIDAYTANARAGKLLQGLGFKPTELENKVAQFSGGWRMRLNLAQALMCRSDLLLLDEPTNHLDLDAVIWLEQWLLNYAGTLLLISHDRDFLDRVTSHIAHIEHHGIKLYSGNYTEFEKRRAEQLAQQQGMYEKQQREIAHIESFIRRFKAKASKAKQAQGRVKALERMELIAQAHVDSPFNFQFYKPEKLPHPLTKLEEISAGYGELKILDDLNLTLVPGDRIGLLGHNGAGKSTLIKLLAGEIAAMQGEQDPSRELKTGYFAQHQLEQLDAEASAMLHLQRLDPRITEQEIRNYLGGFNFHGDRVLEPVAPFSGGEKARLVLALLIYQKPNLLLLDEPTNHLDLEMRHALSLALQDYQGAVVLVSHDRHMLRSVTDQFILVDGGKATPFDGDLDSYRQWLLQPREQAPTSSEPVEQPKDNLSKKQQRQQQAEKRRQLQPLKNQQKKLEQRMEALNVQKQQMEQELANPELYEVENKSRLQELTQQQTVIIRELDGLEESWLQVAEELEALG
ncbi:MAG: ATP-binding cassette domain-containing protein [Gammaproteobacteria bacterium]|nr:ATP-binding cassette domain-containing protein [Gammaproteobacteria bacterium]